MAKYDIKKSSAFKRAIKKFENQKKVLEKIEIIIDTLADDIPLEPKHKDHALKGEYAGYLRYYGYCLQLSSDNGG